MANVYLEIKIPLLYLKDNKTYIITFDEYELDTVEKDGKYLTAKNPVVKKIIKNSEKIRFGGVPEGFAKPKK